MKAILICNGNINSKYLYAHIKKNDFVIAVDGGANKLTKTIFTPDLIIGDMDSCKDKKFWQSKIFRIQFLYTGKPGLNGQFY